MAALLYQISLLKYLFFPSKDTRSTVPPFLFIQLPFGLEYFENSEVPLKLTFSFPTYTLCQSFIHTSYSLQNTGSIVSFNCHLIMALTLTNYLCRLSGKSVLLIYHKLYPYCN